MTARAMTWISADGVATVLDGSAGILLQANPVGLEAPNPTNTIDEYAVFMGGVLANRRYPTRSIAMGLYFEHASRVETVLAAAAAMLRGPGSLQWADDDHTRTLRQVIYEAGLDGNGVTTLREATRVVSLLALNPYWVGPDQSSVLSVAAPTASNAAISSDSAIPSDGGGSVASLILGDVETYPVVSIQGPATTLVVGSGGLSWAIASPLGISDSLIVDHRPESRGPRKNGGAVDWSLLSPASRLFPLQQGLTTIITGATGTGASTTLILSYNGLYLTP